MTIKEKTDFFKEMDLLEKKDLATRDQEFQRLQSEYFDNPTDENKRKLWVYMGLAVKSAVIKLLSKDKIFVDEEWLESKVIDGIMEYLHFTIDKGKKVEGKLCGYAYFIARLVVYNKKEIFNDKCDNLDDFENNQYDEETDEKYFDLGNGKYFVIIGRTLIIDGFKIHVSKNDNLEISAVHSDHSLPFTEIMKAIAYLVKINGIKYLTINSDDRLKYKPHFTYEPFIKKAVKMKLVTDYYQVPYDDNTFALKVR